MSQSCLVSFVIITYNRKEELQETINLALTQNYHPIEIIVVDNNSSDGTEKLFQPGNKKVQYVKLSENLGVAGGRNEGISRASGDIIICLDDDALLIDPEATSKIVAKLRNDPSIGVLAFKSINYYTKRPAREELPYRNKQLDPNKEIETSYYIGVGHAIKKEVYQKVGLYPADFFYAFEELDLSFRIVDAGFRIIYFPEVTVLHKKSPKGRGSGTGVWTKMLENRIKTSIRNLPWRYVLLSSLVWTAYILVKTRGQVGIVLNAYNNIVRSRKKLLQERKPVKPETVQRIGKLGGRLLY